MKLKLVLKNVLVLQLAGDYYIKGNDKKNSNFKSARQDQKEKRLGMHSFHRYYGKLIQQFLGSY